jgi:hypothetical protein
MLSANFNILPLQLHNVSGHEGPGLQQRERERRKETPACGRTSSSSVSQFFLEFFFVFFRIRRSSLATETRFDTKVGGLLTILFFFLFDHNYPDELKQSAAVDVAPHSYKQERGEGRVQKLIGGDRGACACKGAQSSLCRVANNKLQMGGNIKGRGRGSIRVDCSWSRKK